MGFTVTRDGGTKDAEFEAYARLLRQKGFDLAKVERVPEPGSGRRWLHVWNAEGDAHAFAEELKKRTRDDAWKVVPVDAPASEGPLGPIEIQVGRQGAGWAFVLHPFSRQMVQKLFPNSCCVPSVFIAAETQQDYLATMGNLPHLAEQVAIILTSLDIDQVNETFGGYRLYEPATRKELVAAQQIHA